MSASKPSSEEAVAKALATGTEMTGVELATATGLGRSTVGKALSALERAGIARRHRGGRDSRHRLPDRWSIRHRAERDDRDGAAAQRLRPGQLDRLVLDHIESRGTDTMGVTAVAKALGRSAGAVGNCLTRLVAAGRVRQVSDKPRRYSSATATSGKSRRSRKATS